MKKIIPIFLILCLFLFVILLWLVAEDDNKILKSRIDWYVNLKTPEKCEQIIKDTCQVKVYEPEVFRIEPNCPECPVYEECSPCYTRQDNEDDNMKLLREIKYLRDKCIFCPEF